MMLLVVAATQAEARRCDAASTGVPDITVDRIAAMTYDPLGRLLTETTWAGSPAIARTTSYTLDGVGRVILTTDPENNTAASIAFGRGSQVIERTLTDSLGARDFVYVFDDLGRLESETEQAGMPGSATIQYGYDVGSRRTTVTDAEGMVTQTAYDGLNQVTKVTQDKNGLAQVVIKAYTQLGNLRTETAYDGPNQTGNAQVTTYTHDKQGRRTSVIFPDTSSWQYELDDAGLIKQRTDARGIVTVYDRNWRGQVLTATVNGQQEEYYEYDELGHRTLARRDADNHVSFSYDDLGNLTSEMQTVWGETRAFNYPDYTQSGKRQTVQYPSDTGVTLVYEYDKLDNVTAIKRNGVDLIAYPQYAGDRWLERIITLGASPATTLTSTADRLGLARRVYGITHLAQRDSQTTYSESLNYADRDLLGSPNTVVRSGYAPTAGTSSYLYDTMHRVSDAAYSADSTAEDINLDVLGNRTTYTGRSGPQITYTHNLVNQYTALSPQAYSPQYDANGNLTRNDRGFRFEYDYENRLTSVKAPDGVELAMYRYDALGRRNSEYRTDGVVPDAATAFFYDGQNVAVEYDYDTGDLLRYYVHGATYVDERAVVHEAVENKDYAFAVNDVYSVISLVNDQGQVVGAYTYDVYGLIRPASTTDRGPGFAFQGRPLTVFQTAQGATLSIYDFRARAYDPVLGRFMQHDPAEYIDSYNLYLALGGNPLVWMDPTGRFTYGDLLSTAATGAQLYGQYTTGMSIVGAIRDITQGISYRNVVLDLTLNLAANYAGGKMLDVLVDIAGPLVRRASSRVVASVSRGFSGRPGHGIVGQPGMRVRHGTVKQQLGYHDHHGFPQKYRDDFATLGIDVDDPAFIFALDAENHLSVIHGAGRYNEIWEQFLRGERGEVSPQAAMDLLIELARKGFVE